MVSWGSVAKFPSAMSLVTSVLDGAFGFWSLPDAHRARYLDRLYGGLVMLLSRFTDDWHAARIDRSRVFVVPFPRLMGDFDHLMADALAFVDHPVDDALAATLAARAEKQRAYESPHTYDLARFGLEEARILANTARFRETFLDD